MVQWCPPWRDKAIRSLRMGVCDSRLVIPVPNPEVYLGDRTATPLTQITVACNRLAGHRGAHSTGTTQPNVTWWGA